MKSPIELANSPLVKQSLTLTKADVMKNIEQLKMRSVEWHLSLWSEDMKVRAENIRYMKKHPLEARARERSALLFLTHFGNTNGEDPKPPAADSPRDVTGELEKMGDEELKKLAGIVEEKP